jgi:hypothetical protein
LTRKKRFSLEKIIKSRYSKSDLTERQSVFFLNANRWRYLLRFFSRPILVLVRSKFNCVFLGFISDFAVGF